MALKAKAKRAAGVIGRGLLARAKSHIPAGGVGAAARVAAEMAGENIEFVRDNWYGEPAAIFAASLLTTKPILAHGLAGAAGYAAAFNYQLSEFQNGKREKSPVRDFTAKKSEGDAKGRRDAGALHNGDDRDAGMFFNANEVN